MNTAAFVLRVLQVVKTNFTFKNSFLQPLTLVVRGSRPAGFLGQCGNFFQTRITVDPVEMCAVVPDWALALVSAPCPWTRGINGSQAEHHKK